MWYSRSFDTFGICNSEFFHQYLHMSRCHIQYHTSDGTGMVSKLTHALAAHQVLGESRLLRAACRLSAAFHDAGCTTEVRSVLTRRLTHLPATTHALTSFHQAGECTDEGGEARGAAVARMALEDCRQLRQRAGDTLTTFAF